MSRQINGLCGAILLLMAGQVSALTTWTLSTSGAVNGVGDDSTVTATSTGWANTAGTSLPIDDQQLQQQSLVQYSGLGMTNLDSASDTGEGSTPEHAIDNNGRYEMVLLSFNARVNLTGVTFGWTGTSDYSAYGGDSDYSILAYTPTSGFSSLAGQTWDSLQAGWMAIGNYANATTSSIPRATGTGVYSSYWLIGAYNPLAAGVAGGTSPWSLGNDYIKLKSVVGTVRTSETSVPEPGSLALIVLALFSMLYMRGRRQA